MLRIASSLLLFCLASITYAQTYVYSNADDENDIIVGNIEGLYKYFDVEKRDFVEDDDDYSYFDSGYTQDELDDMYREAFEGDPEAQWNID